MLKSVRNQSFLSLLVVISIMLTGFNPLKQENPPRDDLILHITQVDTSQFPEVTVYVSATNFAGEPVPVDSSGFILEENSQLISSVKINGMGEVGSLTTLLVMDISGSMNSSGKLQAAKAAAQAYIQQMRSGDQVGLLTFNTVIDLVQPVTIDHQAVIASIKNLSAKNDTTMNDALINAVQILQPIVGRKTIIVLTDGLDNRSTSTTADVLGKIGPAGLSISTISLGDPTHGKGAQSAVDEAALISLAKNAGGIYGYAANDEQLRNLYERYGRALQAEYQLTYTSPSSVRDGINRALSISFESEVTQIGKISYNPGGLVPEIAEQPPWSLFLILLSSLLLLLIMPNAVRATIQWIGLSKKSKSENTTSIPMIKLKD